MEKISKIVSEPFPLFQSNLGICTDATNHQSIVSQQCQDQDNSLHSILTDLRSDSKPYVKALEKAYTANVNEKVPLTVLQSEIFCFHRQFNFYLDTLHNLRNNIHQKLVHFGNEYNNTMIELRRICRSRSAVPVDQVYPFFVLLSKIWAAWRYENVRLKYANMLSGKLKTYIEVSGLE